jgi:RNA polymerase sigma-B factor
MSPMVGLAMVSQTTSSSARCGRPSVDASRRAEPYRASAHPLSTSVADNHRAANRREERRLLLRYHRAGDAGARDELVHRFLPLARALARRYQHGGEPMDDLVQVASVGLLKAIDRFDPSRRTTLSTFAIPTILGELKRYFRDHGWAVHVPRRLKERAVRVEEATAALWRELGRPPTSTEIAAHTGTTPDQVLEARHVAGAYRAVALDMYGHNLEGVSQAESLGIEDPGFTTAEQAATVERFMRVLNKRQREILRMRFGEDLTHSEIGERVGVSDMHISRLIRQSIAVMQEIAERQEQAR